MQRFQSPVHFVKYIFQIITKAGHSEKSLYPATWEIFSQAAGVSQSILFAKSANIQYVFDKIQSKIIAIIRIITT